ncbi:hypothetical protein ACTXT7_017553, partial [Hymenolepis weldensis]
MPENILGTTGVKGLLHLDCEIVRSIIIPLHIYMEVSRCVLTALLQQYSRSSHALNKKFYQFIKGLRFDYVRPP